MTERIGTVEGFFGLEREWEDLADGFALPTLRHAFNAAALAAHGGRARLAILVARRHGAVVGIAPLREAGTALAPRLELIGHELHEPAGFLFRDRAALGALVTAAVGLGRPMRLARLAADGPELALFSELSSRYGFTVRSDGGATLGVPLGGGPEAILRGMTAERRAKMRRCLSRLQKAADVRFEALAPSAREVPDLLAEFLRLEAAGWKGRAGSAILHDRWKEAFFRDYATRTAAEGTLRLYGLRADGALIAARFAVRGANRLHEFKIAYDEAWGRFAPGLLLTQETLCLAAAEGLERHEFLGRAADWERNWSHESREFTTLRFYPFAIESLGTLTGELADLLRPRTARPNLILPLG
ncbi:hypothetical protein ASG48_02530 [Aurantimonas sp. Leaf443]|nr:hypothetical protein ASG48_02530 [Aurantimonas sp. Leaf443]